VGFGGGEAAPEFLFLVLRPTEAGRSTRNKRDQTALVLFTILYESILADLE